MWRFLTLSLFVCGVSFGQPAAPSIDDLIRRLGSSSFQERQAAAKALDAQGPLALPALQKAVAESDIEVRRRAIALYRQIDKRISTARLLTAKPLKVSYKEAPVLDVVNDLALKTGYAIRVEGDRASLQDRKVTF